MTRTKLTVTGILLGLGLVLSAGATTTHYVSPDGKHISPFTSMADAATNLAPAMAAAPDGGTVIVDRGHYRAFAGKSITGHKSLTITSLWGAAETIIDGYFESVPPHSHWADGIMLGWGTGTVRIYGLTLTGFKNYAIGFRDGGERIGYIQDCIIENNTTRPAILHAIGNLTITGTFVRNNTTDSEDGAGINSSGIGQFRLYDSYVYNNTAGGAGGGIRAAAGNTIIKNTVVSNNTASGHGGGILTAAGRIIDACIIVDNTSSSDTRDGGGVYSGDIYNSLIARNSSGRNGGGTAQANIFNCTVMDNTAVVRGGGADFLSGAMVINSIIYDNEADHPSYPNTHNHYRGGAVTWENNLTDPDPPGAVNSVEFEDLLLDNYRPVKHSPVINAGKYLEWMNDAVDPDGNPRLDWYYGEPDVGAFEWVTQFDGTLIIIR